MATTKTKPASVPVLQDRIRLFEAQRSAALDGLQRLARRQESYEQSCRVLGQDEVERRVAGGMPESGLHTVGGWGAYTPPAPEDTARLQEILRDVEADLAEVRRQLERGLPWDPIAAAREIGASYYAVSDTRIGGVRLLAGEPVPPSALATLPPSKVEQLVKTWIIKEIE